MPYCASLVFLFRTDLQKRGKNSCNWRSPNAYDDDSELNSSKWKWHVLAIDMENISAPSTDV